MDADGETHEKVYDVAWSDDREPGADGKLPPVGNTVDVANATWTNTIGAAELITVWEDPDFDPGQRSPREGRRPATTIARPAGAGLSSSSHRPDS